MKLDDPVCVNVNGFWFGGQIIDFNEQEQQATVEYIDNDKQIQTIVKSCSDLKEAYNNSQNLIKGQEILALWSNDDNERYCIAFYEAVLTHTPDVTKSYITKCRFKKEAKERFIDIRSIFIM